MDIYAEVAQTIIKEQEAIIGPIALEQAGKVPGIKVDMSKKTVSLEGNQTEVLEKLVEVYQHFFGQTSVEVCKEAVRHLMLNIPADKIPTILR
jgi:hypothetical protein